MRRPLLALLAGLLLVPAAMAAGPDDVAKSLYQFIDAFNNGNMSAAYDTYAAGDVTIVDEFAPHLWIGPHAARDWAAAYDKHAQATGVSDGRVTYKKATRIEVEGDVAYVIVPTVYLYKEHGKAMQEEGQITAVMHKEQGGWKIRSWTWSGVTPHAAR